MRVKDAIQREMFEMGQQLKGLGHLLQGDHIALGGGPKSECMSGIGFIVQTLAARANRLSEAIDLLRAQELEVKIDANGFDPIASVMALSRSRQGNPVR